MDLTQPQFAGHDVFVAGVWTPTVAGTPCDEAATMHVFGFDGTNWTPFDTSSFAGVANGNICRPHATSHTEPGSAGPARHKDARQRIREGPCRRRGVPEQRRCRCSCRPKTYDDAEVSDEIKRTGGFAAAIGLGLATANMQRAGRPYPPRS